MIRLAATIYATVLYIGLGAGGNIIILLIAYFTAAWYDQRMRLALAEAKQEYPYLAHATHLDMIPNHLSTKSMIATSINYIMVGVALYAKFA